MILSTSLQLTIGSCTSSHSFRIFILIVGVSLNSEINLGGQSDRPIIGVVFKSGHSPTWTGSTPELIVRR